MYNGESRILCALFFALQINFFIGAFYDGVILLGMALNETLTEKKSILDGRSVTLRMWNRTIQGLNFFSLYRVP